MLNVRQMHKKVACPCCLYLVGVGPFSPVGLDAGGLHLSPGLSPLQGVSWASWSNELVQSLPLLTSHLGDEEEAQTALAAAFEEDTAPPSGF